MREAAKFSSLQFQYLHPPNVGFYRLFLPVFVLIFVESSASSTACDSNPCQNDGTCEDIGNGNYACECPGVYGGDNCEKGKTLKMLV